jgi:acetyl-CoA carboxylase carboxyl transferase subunit beta
MVDMVVHRHKMRETLANLCRLLMKQPAYSDNKAEAEIVQVKPVKDVSDGKTAASEVVELEPVDSDLKPIETPADKPAAKSGAKPDEASTKSS